MHGTPAPLIAYFPSLDKAVASAVNAAKSTLGGTDGDIVSERSAKGGLLAQVCTKARASLGAQQTEQRLLIPTIDSRFSVGTSPTAFIYDVKRHDHTLPPSL